MSRFFAQQVLIAIPARNESASIGDVVTGVRKLRLGDIIVIDDASTDATAVKARESGAKVVRMPFRMGAWGAAQSGIKYGVKKGYGLCLTIDGDGQHPPDALPSIVEPVLQGVSDVAIGVCPERVSIARYTAWSLFRRITGLNLQDVTSGLRAYNREAMQVVTTQNAEMLNYQDIGVLLMLREAGMRVSEVRVNMNSRHYGRSRVYDSWWTVFRYLTETFVLSAGNWRPSWHMNDMFIASSEGREPK